MRARICSGWPPVGETEAAASPGDHVLEELILVFPIEEVASGDAIVVAVDLGPDHDKLVRIGVRHGSEESGVDDAENSGVGADTQCEREKGNGSETEVFC